MTGISSTAECMTHQNACNRTFKHPLQSAESLENCVRTLAIAPQKKREGRVSLVILLQHLGLLQTNDKASFE